MDGDNQASRLHALLQTGTRQSYSKGQVFQHSNDNQHLCLIVKGFVKRYTITNRGSLGVQVIYGQNDVFPLTHAFKLLLGQSIYKGQEVYYYETMSKVELCVLENTSLLDAVTSDSSLYRDLFAEAGHRLESNIQRLENLSLTSSYHQVAHQLHYFVSKYGTISQDGHHLEMPLTQQDMADILGASRETISTAMTKLRKAGLLEQSHGILVPNLEKLLEESYK